jgi:hypothetical protein
LFNININIDKTVRMPISFSDFNTKRQISSKTKIKASEFKTFIFDMPKYNYDISVEKFYNNDFKPNFSYSYFQTQQNHIIDSKLQGGIDSNSVQIRNWILTDNTDSKYPGGAILNDPYVYTESSVFANEFAAKAFDSNTSNTFWHSGLNYNGFYTGTTGTTVSEFVYYGDWLQIKLPNITGGIILSSYTIQPRDTWGTRRGPRDFVIAGSNNGSDWVLVDIKLDIQWTDASQTFSITNTNNTTKYLYYRLIIMRIGNTNTVVPEYTRLTYNVGSPNFAFFTYTKSVPSPQIKILLIGGGGSGGVDGAGGGGGGGVYENFSYSLANKTMRYGVEAGVGGGVFSSTGRLLPSDGLSARFGEELEPSYALLIAAAGGGKGGNKNENGRSSANTDGYNQVANGGGGGGGHSNNSGGGGKTSGGQAYDSRGGGGGGAGTNGFNANTSWRSSDSGKGGNGVFSTLLGYTVSGGGGGGDWWSGPAASGGSGGGGTGGGGRADGGSGTAYGAGGGGCGAIENNPGKGANGVVIIEYRSA